MEGHSNPNAGRSRGRGRAGMPQQQSNTGRGRRPGPNQPMASGGQGQSQGQGQRQGQGQGQTQGQAQAPRGALVQSGQSQARGAGDVVQRPSCSTAVPSQRPPAPIDIGRGTLHRQQQTVDVEAGGQVVKESARGAVRGKRVIQEIIRTRAPECVSKTGTTGKSIVVQANYFRVLKKPNWSIYQYRVDFSPDVDMIRLRRAYLYEHRSLFGGFIFDGTVLFCTNYFGDQMKHGHMELLTKNREEETIQIKIKYVGTVDATDMHQLQVLNLILRRAMQGLNLQLVGRNFFDRMARVEIDTYKLEIWPGYQTSIRQHEKDVLLCAEIAHKVMRLESVHDIYKNCFRGVGADVQELFKREIVGKFYMNDYLRVWLIMLAKKPQEILLKICTFTLDLSSIVMTYYNNKTYRVDDVDFNSSPSSKFQTKDGEISYSEYYKKRYNIEIADYTQPLLVSRPTERDIRGGQNEFIMLIPQLCRATGITDAMRSNFRLMKTMSEHTRLNPERRIERLRVFNQRLHQAQASIDVLNDWNLKLDNHLVEIPARVLPPERIFLGANKRYMCDERADWTREFRNVPMYAHTDIKNWHVVVPRRNVRDIQDFINKCISAARGMKMYIAEPKYEEMPDDRNGSYAQAITNAAAKDPQILMIVLPTNSEDKYCCVKKRCCVDRPVPSQVVTLRTVAQRGDKAAGLMSIATKVVIQMNAKLMGAPWLIDLPLNGLMTIGFDVCHSGKEKNKSYGALVATMDIKLSTSYYSAVMEHLKGQELSNELSMNMTYAIKAYRDKHGCLPERILFYRDGVGDGQLHQVINTEVEVVKKKLNEIYKSAGSQTGPRFAFVVVSKRINTRYFVNRQNPVPGTVVDDVITLPERYDFYLVSQSVRQGTVSPTSYNIIYDTMKLPADKMQILTYKMTHLYYNWSGTCRVPAVCQYAHKLAFLVAESIHRAPSNALENKLYFL